MAKIIRILEDANRRLFVSEKKITRDSEGEDARFDGVGWLGIVRSSCSWSDEIDVDEEHYLQRHQRDDNSRSAKGVGRHVRETLDFKQDISNP